VKNSNIKLGVGGLYGLSDHRASSRMTFPCVASCYQYYM